VLTPLTTLSTADRQSFLLSQPHFRQSLLHQLETQKFIALRLAVRLLSSYSSVVLKTMSHGSIYVISSSDNFGDRTESSIPVFAPGIGIYSGVLAIATPAIIEYTGHALSPGAFQL